MILRPHLARLRCWRSGFNRKNRRAVSAPGQLPLRSNLHWVRWRSSPWRDLKREALCKPSRRGVYTHDAHLQCQARCLSLDVWIVADSFHHLAERWCSCYGSVSLVVRFIRERSSKTDACPLQGLKPPRIEPLLVTGKRDVIVTRSARETRLKFQRCKLIKVG